MTWYNYIASFLAGMFLANVVPHFVHGISGDPFPTPFAHPPGKGLSSPTTNVVWALVNLIVGYVLFRVGKVSSGGNLALAVFVAGIAALSMWLSMLFAKNKASQSLAQNNARKQFARMRTLTASDAAKAVVRRNTEEVQGKGKFDIFEELFAEDFVDHTPQPNMTPDKAGVRKLYGYIRDAFPDFHPKIHWQLADGDRVITYKTYYGTHEGDFLGIAPTHRKIHFETVDVMRVRDGKITDHWGVGNLFSLMQQLGVLNF
jgi:steroid delta-isomerase-like uncharacterized protein